ncbi:GAF domain-containing protein [Arthrobacter sp. Z1-15]
MTDEKTAINVVSLPGRLQDMVLESADVDVFLSGLAQLAADHFSATDNNVLCAVTLLRPQTRTTIASNSQNAAVMDQVQFRFDDGPCLRAAREGLVYVVSDFTTDARFGGYSKAATEHGIHSALGVPIPLDGLAAAGLNLYAPKTEAFGDKEVVAAEGMAQEMSRALRLAVRLAHMTEASQQLKAAMSSRTSIDVAAGIIMAQNRCSHDTAMSILKAASNGRNMKLHLVVAAVIEAIGQQTPETHFKS